MSRLETRSAVILAGVRAARHALIAAVWTWIATLLISLPIASAMGTIVAERVGWSLDAEAFARGGLPAHLAAIARASLPTLQTFLPMFVAALVMWAVLSSYFTGATIAAVNRGAPTSMHELFTGSGRVFGRLLRLTALGLPFWALVVGLTSFAAWRGVAYLTEQWVSDGAVLAARFAALLVVLCVAGWASSAYDLMRVEAVSRGEHRARWAFARGLARAVKRPLSVMLIISPFGAASIGLTLLSLLVDVRVPRSSFTLIAIGFILEQIVAFLRAWLRVATLGAEVAWLMRSSDGGRRPASNRERGAHGGTE